MHADSDSIKKLLAAADLPWSDLTDEHFQHFVTLEHNGYVVGAVGLEMFTPLALLRSLVVKDGEQHKGLGSKLVDKIEEYARAESIRELYLLTTTAEQFFIKHGYRTIDRDFTPEPIKTTAEFSSLCPASAVVMKKAI